jgi:hypothetical protein
MNRSPWQKALWVVKFTLAILVLTVLIPEAALYGVGAIELLVVNSPSHVAAIEKHKQENLTKLRAALPTCEDYRRTHPTTGDPVPAGFIPVNQRGDWLCQP